MSKKQNIAMWQDLESCIDEREALEQAEIAIRKCIHKSYMYEATDDLLDPLEMAITAVRTRLSDIRAVESGIHRKLEMTSQFV
jgi:hypothetical protein